MNVLLVYPLLPSSFWSYSHVAELTFVKALSLPLGPLTVAALLPESCEVRFVDLNVRRLDENDWQWADIIMISGMIIQRDGIRSIIWEAKSRKKIVVAGGPYPSLRPEELIKAGCDFVVCGEGENTIELLFNAISLGDSRKIINSPGYIDLTDTPVPRYDLVNPDDYHQYLVQTTRGCPFSCEFCDIEALYGKYPRAKVPSQIISELDSLYQLGARGCVVIADDNFIACRDNAKEICRELIKWNKLHDQPFGFSTQVSANLGQDIEMLDLMTAANFADVFIGIESPDEEVLKANQKYHNVVHPLVESINTIRNNGLGVIGSFIIGFDNEKKGAGKRICEFIDTTKIPIVMLNMLMAVPGTRLTDRLLAERRLMQEGMEGIFCDSVAILPNFIPDRPLDEIVEEYIETWEYLYHPPRFFERTYRFCLAIRPTRKAAAIKKGEKEKVENLAKTKGPTSKRLLGDLILLLNYLIRHGVFSSYRVQFWKQLYYMRKYNPSRLKKYIIQCIMGEPHLLMSRGIREVLNMQLAKREFK